MIRINLLPFRAARKKENIRRQISVFALSVVCLALLMGFVFLNLSRTVAALETDKAKSAKDLLEQGFTKRREEELKKKIAEVRAKLNVIKELESKKTGPVLLLDELTMAVPKEKLWLTALDEKKGILTLKGTAMDNDTVALFMTNLEVAKHIVSVDLQTAKLNNLPKYKLNVVDFVLTCKTYAHKEKAKPETKKKR